MYSGTEPGSLGHKSTTLTNKLRKLLLQDCGAQNSKIRGSILKLVSYFVFSWASLSNNITTLFFKFKIWKYTCFLFPSGDDRKWQRTFEYAKGTAVDDCLPALIIRKFNIWFFLRNIVNKQNIKYWISLDRKWRRHN